MNNLYTYQEFNNDILTRARLHYTYKHDIPGVSMNDYIVIGEFWHDYMKGNELFDEKE